MKSLNKSAALHGEFGMMCAIGIAEPGLIPSHVIAQSIEGEKDALIALDGVLAEKEVLVGHNIKILTFHFWQNVICITGSRCRIPCVRRGRSRGSWYTFTPWNFCGSPGTAQCRSAPPAFCLGLVTRRRLATGRRFFELFKQGRFEEIGRYVESDVRYTDRIYQQLTRLAI